MSLGVAIKGPEGIVLAADSRVTLEARRGNEAPVIVTYDNATKLLSFSKPDNYIGAVTYGVAVIGSRTAHSYLPEFEVARKKQSNWDPSRRKVEEFAESMSDFYLERWEETMPRDYDGPNMSFVVGGFDPEDAYGKVFLFEIPKKPKPEPRSSGDAVFGMTWGGQLEIASRLIQGFDPRLLSILQQKLDLDPQRVRDLARELQEEFQFRVPYEVLPLQDCVDLASFLIRTTKTAQELSIGIRGVGGPIEVAIITRTKGLEFVQQKKILGERG